MARLVPAAVLMALGLVLSGCGDGVAPGVAAQVEDSTIRTDEVDDLATMICEIDKGAGQPGKTMGAQRSVALTVLLAIEVGRRLGDLEAVPQQQVSESLEAAAGARDFVPEELQDYFDEIVAESTRSAAALDAVAVQSILEQGEQPSQETVQAEVARLQADYLEANPVEVDPRFGVYQDGQIVNGDGSISVAVSDRARSLVPEGTDAAGAPPSSDDLPASHLCS